MGKRHEFETPEIVEVDWIDSYMSHGWDSRIAKLDGDRKPGICKSVGYLIEETEDYIGLAESVSASDNYGCVTFIPTCALVEKRWLHPEGEVLAMEMRRQEMLRLGGIE